MEKGFFSSCDSITAIFDSWLVQISVLQMAMISLHREKRRKHLHYDNKV